MPLTINTNSAASSASYYLSKNNASLQKSLTRLSSGSRITQPADDAGGLAVSMKLSGTINRLSGVEKNIDNAISFYKSRMVFSTQQVKFWTEWPSLKHLVKMF